MKTLTIGIVAMLGLMLAGCSSGTSETAAKSEIAPTGATGGSGSASAIKQYPMHGKVLSLNPAEKSARIDAGPIGDWMGAMTMNYPVKDAAEFAKLSAGETIDATVFVDGDNFWVGDVKAAAEGASGSTGK